jgi:hypothetical protein
MTTTDNIPLTAQIELLACVLSDCLKKSVPQRATGARLGHHQRFGDQLRQKLSGRRHLDAVKRRHALARFECPATSEHG